MQSLDANPPSESDQPAAALPPKQLPATALRAYEPPAVISYTEEQLLEALGPAQAMSYLI